MSGISFIDLEELELHQEILTELAFPSKSLEYAVLVLEELRKIGVNGLYVVRLRESVTPEPVVLGRGYRGIVFRGRMRGRDAAIKILRTDSTLADLLLEAEATRLANRVGVGPKLLGYSPRVLVLEFVEGIAFGKWIERLETGKAGFLKKVLRKCFFQARALDEAGLDHGELSDARKHVIVKSDLTPVIIDFGKASKRRKPSNVTSLFSYITHGPGSEKILNTLGIRAPPMKEIREYKRKMDDQSFRKLLRALNI